MLGVGGVGLFCGSWWGWVVLREGTPPKREKQGKKRGKQGKTRESSEKKGKTREIK